ncbi:hypothetical protein [Endozoicomonas atrinae]|uniref:hypothetical protein n=1 Tax=Endozoicomonas atrinae TaxID=1333660 RepID=UPI003AFFFB56
MVNPDSGFVFVTKLHLFLAKDGIWYTRFCAGSCPVVGKGFTLLALLLDLAACFK